MKKQDNWKYSIIGVAVVLCLGVLIGSLAKLQLRSSYEYGALAESSTTKTITERGTRGQILDGNGSVLAYDRKMYNIQFYRDPTSKQAQNGEYSKSIWEVIKLLRSEGKEVSFPFWLALDASGEWYFETGTTDAGVAKNREDMFRSNFYVKKTDTQNIFDELCSNYMIHEIDEHFPEEEKLTLGDKLQILGVWQEMQMNAFNSVPIVLAKDVKWSTVIEIETRLVTLSGISVAVENQRVYPKGTLACHILGYIGLMQNLDQINEYTSKGYQVNDMIGMDGIERSMEQWLTGNSDQRRGKTVWEVDRSGRRIRQLSKTDPTDGNTVKLTIDSALQQVVESELEKAVNMIRDNEEAKLKDNNWINENREALTDYEAREQSIKLAQNGAIVVLDMQCRVKAMASYPNFDPNLFIIGMDEEQRIRMLKDPRNPLFNNAIRARDTPGSVFKMATALAALANGKLTVSETISDLGPYTLYDRTSPPRCWIAPHRISLHANQTVVEGIAHSCNYFFYTIASRLNEDEGVQDGELLYQYAAKLGLTSKTNIDLPNEEKSVVGSQLSLYDQTKPITGTDQSTWLPVQVKAALKKHLRLVGERYQVTYTDDRLDKCIKALMDMAVNTDQGTDQQGWVMAIRPILMEELGMSMEMVYKQFTIGDIVHYLNEIKFGGTNSIMTAIGQGVTLTTPVAMARYVAAVANGGYVYDVQIIDSIISPNGDVVQSFEEPLLVNDLSAEIGGYLPYIHRGMKGVVDDSGTASRYFSSSWEYYDDIAAKTGTAEKSELDVESNAWFVAFAPLENPEIAIAVYIPQGLSGAMAGVAAKGIIEYYLDSKVDSTEVVLPAPNALSQ